MEKDRFLRQAGVWSQTGVRVQDLGECREVVGEAGG